MNDGFRCIAPSGSLLNEMHGLKLHLSRDLVRNQEPGIGNRDLKEKLRAFLLEMCNGVPHREFLKCTIDLSQGRRVQIKSSMVNMLAAAEVYLL